jgi:hypothetical protein
MRAASGTAAIMASDSKDERDERNERNKIWPNANREQSLDLPSSQSSYRPQLLPQRPPFEHGPKRFHLLHELLWF